MRAMWCLSMAKSNLMTEVRQGKPEKVNGGKPITILYLIDTCLPPPGTQSRGGAEKQLFLLASSLDPMAFRAIVAQLGPSGTCGIPTGPAGTATLLHVPVRRFYGMSGITQLYRLCRLARREGVDIIHTFFEKSEVMGWLISRCAGIPLWVTSRRDLGFKRKNIYRKLFRWSARYCGRCIAVCRAVAEHACAEGSLPLDKIQVIYNGLDFSPYRTLKNPADARRDLGIPETAPVVGMIANMNFEIKGHDFFLAAAGLILAQAPDTIFILVGDGPLRRLFEETASRKGIRDKVLFLGTRSDAPAILSAMDVSVLSSTSEGMSNVILESMAAGKPMVATSVGGNPELVIDGVTGLMAPPADADALAEAVLSLLNDPARARIMGNAGRERVVREFTVEAMVRKHEQLYEHMMSRNVDATTGGGGES